MLTARAAEAQIRWEVEGVRRAVARYRQLEGEKDASEKHPVRSLLLDIVGPLSVAIKERQALSAQRAGGNKGSPYDYLILTVPAKQLAVVVATTALRSYVNDGNGMPVLTMAVAVASAMRLQVEFSRWEEKQGRDDAYHKRTVERVLGYVANKGLRWERVRKRLQAARVDQWDPMQAIHLGTALIDCLVKALPERFRLEDISSGSNYPVRRLLLSEETMADLRDRSARAEVARPMLLPMIVPPNPWRYDG